MLSKIVSAALTVVIVSALLAAPMNAQAQSRTIIRDAEIENIIRSFAVPLFQAAGLNPDHVKIRLVEDSALNAFVAGGQNIFIHTGLIFKAGGPDALIGVIAHETGHIEGGHLVRTRAAIEQATAIQMIGTILGAAAAVAAKDGDVGRAVIMGSQSAGMRDFLQYSRTQESAADQAAIRLLDDTERSAKGLEEFLAVLQGQEVLTQRHQDPYVRSHPLSRQRMDTLNAHNQTSPYADQRYSAEEKRQFDRMVAKLMGYIEPLRTVLKRYPETDTSFAARYARAIAYYRAPDLERALDLVNALIADHPNDPYLYELKGQMLFEHGRMTDSHAAYTRAFKLAPREPLIALELARAELELGGEDALKSAVEHFRQTIRLGEPSAFVWQQLGIAHGRLGEMGMSALALAESEFRRGQLRNAEFHATRAAEELPDDSAAHLQALDILEAVKVARAGAAQNQ